MDNLYAGVIFYNDTPELLTECLTALKKCNIKTIAIDGVFKEFQVADKSGLSKPYSTDGCIEVAQKLADYYVPAPPWCWQDQAQKRSCYLHLIPEKSRLIVVDADEIIQEGIIEQNDWAPILRVLMIPENFSSVRVYRTEAYLKYLYRHCSIYDLTKHLPGNLSSGALVQAHKDTNALLPMLHYKNGNPVVLNHRKADRPDKRKALKETFYQNRKECEYQQIEEHPFQIVNPIGRKKIVGAIATMISRREFLIKTVDSIINQVDELHICFNDYRRSKNIPAELQKYFPKLHAHIPEHDRGSIGRFIWNDNPQAYYCMFDDDLIYPPDYVKYLVTKSEQYQNKCVVTLHGKIFNSPKVMSWRHDIAQSFPCLETVSEDREVHIGGTGAMLFSGELVKVTDKDFENLLYDDIEFSRFTQKTGVSIMVLAHERGYLQYQEVGTDTIWERTTRNPAMSADLDRMVQSIEWRYFRG